MEDLCGPLGLNDDHKRLSYGPSRSRRTLIFSSIEKKLHKPTFAIKMQD